MGSDTDRTRRSLGCTRMMMQSECQCRPEGQQDAQISYPLRNRTHERDPKNALFEFTLDTETKATFTETVQTTQAVFLPLYPNGIPTRLSPILVVQFVSSLVERLRTYSRGPATQARKQGQKTA